MEKKKKKQKAKKASKKAGKRGGRNKGLRRSADAMKSILIDNDEITIIINGKKAASRRVQDYLSEEDYKYMDNEAYKYFLGFAEQHPRLREYLDYQGANLLDFVEEEFSSKSVFSFTLRDIVRHVGAVMKVIDTEKPYKMTVRDKATLKNRIAALVAGKAGIRTRAGSYGIGRRLNRTIRQDIVSAGYQSYLKLQNIKRRAWKRTEKNKGGVLLLPYYANHADVMNPVIKLLRKKGANHDIVCVDNVFNVTKKKLKKYGISHETFENYTSRKVRKLVNRRKKDMRRRWECLKNDDEVRDSITFRKIPLWEILRPRLRHLFLTRFGQVIEHVETTRNIIDMKEPSAAVIANDTSTYGRAACRAAAVDAVPTLNIQHGAIADEPKYSRVFADRMAVEGPAVKKFFVDKGLPADKFIVTGQPRFDKLAKREGIISRDEMCRKLGIPRKKKILVLATQVPECDEHVVRAVYDAVKGMKDAVLVVKLHPAERTDAMYQSLRKETGISNIIIGKDIDLYGLLNACELMMTVFSTTAIEAMMLDKPVITINLTGEPDMMPYAREGAALGVRRKEDIRPAILNVMGDKKTQHKLRKGRQRFIYGRAYKMDGKASQRVVKVIER
ncbi:MAG: CDP-glycerol glycerophosphotransferase family protein, partial [Candidatus Woesearchaeota archaeon]